MNKNLVSDSQVNAVFEHLNRFAIEVPSWGFANTGTRFGKFLQPSAAHTLEEKFSDASQVHQLTGACHSMALHVLWDLPNGLNDVAVVRKLAQKYGVQAGSINPNLFQDQQYKYGSFGNPDPDIRQHALNHVLESISIARELGNADISIWFADGSNYPGTQNIRRRIDWFCENLARAHQALAPGQRMLVEYKPFEPAFYHTDIADWGMALLFARAAGPQALVLVDTGHHYQAQNIEQILAWLQREKMLGGLHFNDRRYADDDLTLGSIDPYQVFRIFHEILLYRHEHPAPAAAPAYMIDQSHNLKNKIEAMLQTVLTAQELYAKACLVDHEKLAQLQSECRLVEAEECLRTAFWTDVRPIVQAWREARGLPSDPLQAFRESGYVECISLERNGKNQAGASSYA
ncbi:MAG TPA: TIM barrel protein [Acidobacteriaceae bacterium]|nr:TIM barrel protein [Acidobacteriaceae bacterium]